MVWATINGIAFDMEYIEAVADVKDLMCLLTPYMKINYYSGDLTLPKNHIHVDSMSMVNTHLTKLMIY